MNAASTLSMGATVLGAVRAFDEVVDEAPEGAAGRGGQSGQGGQGDGASGSSGGAATRGFVYFDLLGLRMFAYSAAAATRLHGGVAVAGLAAAAAAASAARREGTAGPEGGARALAWATLATFAGVAAAVGAGAVFGLALSLVAPMRWYLLGIPGMPPLTLPPTHLLPTPLW